MIHIMEILPKQSTIGVGNIRFYDAIEPPLKAGAHHLSAKQTIDNVPNTDGPEKPSYQADRDFVVQGPQFSLSPGTVHSMYPAPSQTGDFDDDLPNVVMTDFSLPWSRPIDPLQPQDNLNTPWMGLLTIYPGEYEAGNTQITPTNKVIGPKTVTISALMNPAESNVLGPALVAKDITLPLDTKVTVVDVDFSTFQAISPTLEELRFLAHGREVNTGGKVILGMEGDGYFSLLIGNRLPKAPKAPEKGMPDPPPLENNLFKVSYEGQSAYLRRGSAPPAGKTLIRLVLLSSWKFKVTVAQGSFLTLMADLCEEGRGGVQLLQMPGANQDLNNDTAKEALQIGYVALQNDLRVGEKMTSWYRGPLVPAPTERNFDYGPYLYSDHAMHYDPKTGIFNHAYSAAWQIGRLLALSDASFSKAFFDWRNTYINEINRQAASKGVEDNAALIAGVEGSVKLEHSVRALFSTDIKNTNWPQIESRQQKSLGSELPGVLNEEEKKAIIENDEDPLLAILRKTN